MFTKRDKSPSPTLGRGRNIKISCSPNTQLPELEDMDGEQNKDS